MDAPPPRARAAQQRQEEDDGWDGFYSFPTPHPGVPDWSHYRGADTRYVEPLPWVLMTPKEQGITVAPLNVEVWVSIRRSKKEKLLLSPS